MDYSDRLAISYYQTIATINSNHKVFLVQHQVTGKIYVKKILDVFNIHIYKHLKDHPISGTPTIIEYCIIDNKLIVIEEYISGTSLQEIIDNHTLTPQKIRSYTIQLCAITSLLHNSSPSIIHRDIKPTNVIITSQDYVELLDFNAAKFYNENSSTDTILLGTHGYAAPEQYGFGSSSPETDIYSIGILLKAMTESLDKPTREFNTIIKRCTQIDPHKRYNSIDSLKKTLEIKDLNNTPKVKRNKNSKFLLPGYRSGTPWKIVTATIVYAYIIQLCATVKFENFSFLQTIYWRIFSCIDIFVVVMALFNYLNYQRPFPPCKSEYRLVRLISTVILAAIILFVACAIESIVFIVLSNEY